MAKQGRKPGYRHTESTRQKIQAAYLINRLTAHVKGELDMTNTQIRAAETLLKKILPDLSDIKLDVESAPVTFQFDLSGKLPKVAETEPDPEPEAEADGADS